MVFDSICFWIQQVVEVISFEVLIFRNFSVSFVVRIIVWKPSLSFYHLTYIKQLVVLYQIKFVNKNLKFVIKNHLIRSKIEVLQKNVAIVICSPFYNKKKKFTHSLCLKICLKLKIYKSVDALTIKTQHHAF